VHFLPPAENNSVTSFIWTLHNTHYRILLHDWNSSSHHQSLKDLSILLPVLSHSLVILNLHENSALSFISTAFSNQAASAFPTSCSYSFLVHIISASFDTLWPGSSSFLSLPSNFIHCMTKLPPVWNDVPICVSHTHLSSYGLLFYIWMLKTWSEWNRAASLSNSFKLNPLPFTNGIISFSGN
jgi:hypothetical protein